MSYIGVDASGYPAFSSTSGSSPGSTCRHCGAIHSTTCPRIKAIDYHPDGTPKRIEFHSPEQPVAKIAYEDRPQPRFGRRRSGE